MSKLGIKVEWDQEGKCDRFDTHDTWLKVDYSGPCGINMTSGSLAPVMSLFVKLLFSLNIVYRQ